MNAFPRDALRHAIPDRPSRSLLLRLTTPAPCCSCCTIRPAAGCILLITITPPLTHTPQHPLTNHPLHPSHHHSHSPRHSSRHHPHSPVPVAHLSEPPHHLPRLAQPPAFPLTAALPIDRAEPLHTAPPLSPLITGQSGGAV